MNRSFAPLAFLALAAASHAGTTLTASITSSIQINNSLVGYQGTNGDQGAAPVGTVSAGVPLTATATITGSATDYLSYRYTLVGTYGAADDGLVIGLNPAAALSANGQSFSTVFGVSEATIVSYTKGAYRYANGSSADFSSLFGLVSFLSSNSSKLAQGLTGGTLMSFSNGTPVGTVVAAPVPEPAPVAALALGAFGLLRRRKR